MPETPGRDERLERKVSLARERDTRVVITRTIDTHRVLDIIRNADRGIRILRANLLIKFRPEEAVPLLEEYQKAIEGLHTAAEKICEKVGVPYRTRKERPAPADDQGNGEKAGGTSAGDTSVKDQSGATAAGKEDRRKK